MNDSVAQIFSKRYVEYFARRNPSLHFYSLADLDDFFWPKTRWFALQEAGEITQLVLFYDDLKMPIVLAHHKPPVETMRELLRELIPILPDRFYAEMGADVVSALTEHFTAQPFGPHCKMALMDFSPVRAVDVRDVTVLTPQDQRELEALYDETSAGTWFVPRMLETGFYCAIREGSRIVSVAGVHTVSQEYKVAAIGNVATRESHRGRGLATTVTAALCQKLLAAGIDCIGLNVRADNAAAIHCYSKLGFAQTADYSEYLMDRIANPGS